MTAYLGDIGAGRSPSCSPVSGWSGANATALAENMKQIVTEPLGGRGSKVEDGCCFQAEDGIRVLVRSRGLGKLYKRQLR